MGFGRLFKRRAEDEDRVAWLAFERIGQRDPCTWTDWERQLIALGGLRGEVNNGGLDQYFFNSAGDQCLDAVAAADAAGEAELADVLRRALGLLDVGDPTDRSARQDALEALDDGALDALTDEYYRLEDSRDLTRPCGPCCRRSGEAKCR